MESRRGRRGRRRRRRKKKGGCGGETRGRRSRTWSAMGFSRVSWSWKGDLC
jgi:hypothetical protein